MLEFQVDNEAKIPVKLRKMFDGTGQPYYIGKLQFNGTLDFEEGNSFMVFVAEDGVEELQIGPIDPNRRSRNTRSNLSLKNGRLSIDLHPSRDQHGNVFYVGEMQGPSTTHMKHGIFFTIFLSRPGYEELQITRLIPNPKKRQQSVQYDGDSNFPDSRPQQDARPPRFQGSRPVDFR